MAKSEPTPSTPSTRLTARRSLFAGAAGAGALAAAAVVLPQTSKPAAVAVATDRSPDPDGGYQVTPHVLRYYQTAKV
jgi:hypothetical protein